MCYRYVGNGSSRAIDIAGKNKLLPALDGNNEIIARILEGFVNLGYKIGRSKVIFKGPRAASKYFGSVDDFEGKEGGPGAGGGARRDPRDGLRGPGSKADIVIDICMPFIKDMYS